MIVTEANLSEAVNRLMSSSVIIRSIVETYGMPPAWRREPGFSSLVYTILEQQVSLASARAVYERLIVLAGELTPQRYLEIEPSMLREIGFSRQKREYCERIANMILLGELDLPALGTEDDDTIRRTLTSIKGIGPWTADIYLLHSLGRPDVWPSGDLALQVAVQEALGLDSRPVGDELYIIGEEFRPLRSVAARVFWQGYLARRGISDVT